MKVCAVHRCGRQHKAWPALARCMFPHAGWIAGDGPFAVIVGCGVTSVTLHAIAETAEHALETLGATGCGGRCVRRHELVRLDFGAVTEHERRPRLGRPTTEREVA